MGDYIEVFPHSLFLQDRRIVLAFHNVDDSLAFWDEYIKECYQNGFTINKMKHEKRVFLEKEKGINQPCIPD